MHGAGNDFVVLDLRQQQFELNPVNAAHIADRHLGIGCDQILVITAPEHEDHVARYEVWNADGSIAGQCGNGARCIGLFLHQNGDTQQQEFTVESPAGVISLNRCDDGEYEVGMGVPEFEPSQVPHTLIPSGDSFQLDSPWAMLELGAVSMGNPHALLLVTDIDDQNISEMGRFISTHEAFPEGCNAGFAQVVSEREIRLRVVERGAGETLACGSGACAAVAILRQRGVLENEVDVYLPGGHLVIKWPGTRQPLKMKGPAKYVFKGNLNG